MAEPQEKQPANDKAEGKEKKPKKPLKYRRFERLLKQVIKAPPLKKPSHQSSCSEK
jgi:hypothetical protein